MTANQTLAPLDLWRRRFGGRRRIDHLQGTAALSYMTHGAVENGLIEVGALTLIILYPHQVRPGQYALRLSGFLGATVPWSVRWGGEDQCRFVKDLMLQPVHGGPGYHLDAADAELLALGLALERELDRCVRYCRQRIREQVCLPKLWAGFRPADAASLAGDGPELAEYAVRTGRQRNAILRRMRRDHLGLVLFPLAWVSNAWQQAVAVYADLDRFPRRQVFNLQHPDDLAGYECAAEFDFRSAGSASGRQLPSSQILACA